MNDTALSLMQSAPGPYATIDGRRYLYFVGTGYLGLQNHPEVLRAAIEALQRYGVGSATSRAGFGTTQATLDVERRAAELYQAGDAFYFPSGYAAPSILAAALADCCDAMFVDEWSHYCVTEAARQSGRPVFCFRHCDPDDLASSLRRNLRPGQRPLVASDGVFAARGSVAPAAEYELRLRNYAGSALVLDDAHALGVLGANGRGTLEHAGLTASIGSDADGDGPRLFLCGTLSKAVGGYGGIIPGPRRFIQRLKRSSHWFDGASPMPTAIAAATARALELIAAQPALRTALWANVELLKSGLGRLGLAVDATPVPIVCLSLGSAAAMRRIQHDLGQRGILLAYMPAYAGL
ncbi:MAG: pyridoxal phosphate-dependent aminotransferase family protein, partial [Thermoguttaceae bacterium]